MARCLQLCNLCFQRGDPRQHLIDAVAPTSPAPHAGARRHLLDRVEFLPPDQIKSADRVVDPGTDQRLRFLPQPAQGRDGAPPATPARSSKNLGRSAITLLRAGFWRSTNSALYTVAMIMVTGGAGFIGSVLQAALSRRGIETIVVDRLGSEGKWRNLARHPPSRLIPPDELEAFLHGRPPLEVVFHLGAISATTATDGDRPGTPTSNSPTSVGLVHKPRGALRLRVLRRNLRRRHRGASTTTPASKPLERLRPLNLYGWTKHAFDLIVARILAAGGPAPPQWAGFKFFNVYGPNEYHKERMISVVKVKHDEVAAGHAPRLFKSDQDGLADGAQARDFIWVNDVVDVLLWTLDNPAVKGLFNLGTGRARTYLDLAHAVCDAAGVARQVEFIDMPANLRGQYQNFTEARMDRLRAAGYEGQFTPLEAGVRQYIQTYLTRSDPYA